MPFEKLTDAHRDQFLRDGYTVFRGVIPFALLRDLRTMAEQARTIAHRVRNEQANRLAHVAFHMDASPYREFCALPHLVDGCKELLGDDFFLGTPDDSDELPFFSILFEPKNHPYCIPWHRDHGNEPARNDPEAFLREFSTPRRWNQFNCPLYEDTCTWVVPGSHLRGDLPREVERFPKFPLEFPDTEVMQGDEDAELIFLEYTASMPGAVQAVLHPGDFMVYRSVMWHTGNYVTYKRRATLHDHVWSPEGFEAAIEHAKQKVARETASDQ